MERARLFLTYMTQPHLDHPDDEAIERFAMNRCEHDEQEAIDTHIIGCPWCVDRLEKLQDEILDIKVGGTLFLRSQAARKRSWLKRWTIPSLSLAGLAALAAALVLLTSPHDVNLSAYRGSEVVTVPQWRPLHLHLNARDLDAGPVIVQIVDDRGMEIWKGRSTVAQEQVDTRAPAVRNPGEHFIRLEDGDGSVLREFAIEVKLFP
ncbi:MAG: hypothetical protein JOY54_14445 [Acidobacteriaceae bacterium]|nr:hypothetical protein [Acidobacteriaceae bacterium]